MRVAGLLLVPLLTAGAAGAAPAPSIYANVPAQSLVGLKSKLEPSADCRAHIREVMCLFDSLDDIDQAPAGHESCLAGGEEYAAPFEALYDAYPPALQKMFCSLRVLYVLNNFEGTAFGGTLKDENGQPSGAHMGIRRSVLDEGLDLTTWASWKEQLSFGGVSGSYTVTPTLPHIETATSRPVNDFLYFVVTHEFGHIFDFANHLNAFASAKDPDLSCSPTEEVPMDPSCAPAAGSWTSLSWESQTLPLVSQRFAYRKGLCFYWCDDEGLTEAAVPEAYSGLAASNFISMYAATNPWDDFADSLAYYVMRQELGTSYVIDTVQASRYDIMGKIDSDVFTTKRQYIAAFLARDGIVYP
jgi:hypothetical protein